MDQITTGVITADRRMRVSFANRMALETLGLTPEECLGREILQAFGKSTAVERALGSLKGSREARLDFSLSPPDGRRLELGMTLLRPGDDAPEDMALVFLFRDLGDRRQMEMELRRVERLTAIGNMVAGFAHEVRNPLAAIQALAEALLAESAPDDPRREYANRILSLLGRVERFVKASLRFGEPKAPVSHRHRPADLLAAALDALAPRWGRNGCPPSVRVEPGLPPVEVDESQIVECLLALLENALDATGDAARVEVRIGPTVGEIFFGTAAIAVSFEVRDGGPGIPESHLSRIFDPFFTTKPKGTGLGLALAQTLVRENGGRLQVRSVPGIETVFTLVLPGAEP